MGHGTDAHKKPDRDTPDCQAKIDITEHAVSEHVHATNATSHRYKRRVIQVSLMMASQSRLGNMRDSSLYWIEYAARHKHQHITDWLMPKGAQLNHIHNFNVDTLFTVGVLLIICVKMVF
jgi:hypothetical protein